MSRNQVILGLLERGGFEVKLARVHLWEEKRYALVDQPKGRLLLRAAAAYLRLVVKLLQAPKHDLLLALYPGYFDMPLLWIASRMRRVPLMFDAFISLHDTVVADRALRDPRSAIGRLTLLADRISCRLADRVLADTPEHAAFLADLTAVPAERFRVLWVGAQEDTFHPVLNTQPEPDLVLFYGMFIPLQGIETIVRAAKLLENGGIRVRVVGDGQERSKINALVRELSPRNVELVGRVPLEDLPRHIASASLCLGIFGTTPKALRVVPNKIYQCLACGRPVLTADTPAIRTAFDDELALVPPGNAPALANKIQGLMGDSSALARLAVAGRRRFERDYSNAALTRLLSAHIVELMNRGRPASGRRQ
jgi:glycosyltransferase involved in cell wall biosynthesis